MGSTVHVEGLALLYNFLFLRLCSRWIAVHADKLDLGQAIKLGKTSRWSFDSALLPQYVHGRPGIVER